MNLLRPDLFISATSADLAPAREIMKKAVLDLGAHPIEQAHFPPAGQTVAAMLYERIAASHAVIHLVGECYGVEDETAAAALDHRTYAEGRRSYTQLEYDLANELGKPLYVFICAEKYRYRKHKPEPDEKQLLQVEHRAQFASNPHLHYTVRDTKELRDLILRLPEWRIRIMKWTRRAAIVAAIIGILLGVRIFVDHENAKRHERQIETLQAALLQSEKNSGAQMELVGRVLDKAGVGRANVGSKPGHDAIVTAQIETAAEWRITLDQVRQRLAAAETNAAERVRLATELEELARGEMLEARQAKCDALTDLAEAALANLKYPEAVQHYSDAADLTDRVEYPYFWIKSHIHLGSALFNAGRYEEAIKVWQDILSELKKNPKDETSDVLDTQNWLALSLFRAGKFAAAEAFCRMTLESSERRFGRDNSETVIDVNNLAIVLHAKGDFVTAEALLRRALEVQERIFGVEHPNALVCVNNLAELLKDKGDYTAAEPLYRRAFEARERVSGGQHPDTLLSVSNLAAFLCAKADYATAEPLLRRALEARERLLGAEHPDTLTSVNNLAELLHFKGDNTAAEPLLRRALEARERLLGGEHPDTLTSVNNLAILFEDKGDIATAETLLRRALEARERLFGAEHPDTLTIVSNLAALLEKKRDYAAAEVLYRRATTVSERILGPAHPETCAPLYNYAMFLNSHGRKAEAKPLAWQAYRGVYKSEGVNQEHTRKARQLLIDLGEKVEE